MEAAELVSHLVGSTSGRGSSLRWRGFRGTWTTTVEGYEVEVRQGDGGRFSPEWELLVKPAGGFRNGWRLSASDRSASQVDRAMRRLVSDLAAA